MRPSAQISPQPSSRLDTALARIQLFLLALLAASILISAAEPAQAALSERPGSAAAGAAGSYDVLGLGAETLAAPDDEQEQWQGSQLVSGWDNKNLPIFRWLEASSQIRTRINGQDLTAITARMSQGQVIDTMMSAGNLPFHATTFITQAATELDIINVAGFQIDQAFSSIGKALLSSGLVGLVIVFAIGIAMWQMARRLGRGGGSPLVTLTKPLLLVTIFGIFLAGSTASTESGPGAGSPWWVAQKTNTVVSALTAAPAAALVAANLDAGYNWADDPDADTALSCQTYVNTMRQAYQTESENYAGVMTRSMPLVLSGMWELTGLPTYSNAQFGHNQFATHVFCRGLDENANLSPEQRIEHNPGTQQADEGGDSKPAWPFTTSGDVAWNINMMHWSACRYDGESFSIKEDWDIVPKMDDTDSVQKVCSDWWDTPWPDFEINDSPLNIDGNVYKNDALADAPHDLRSFISTTQGFEGSSNTMAVMIFVIVAWVISLVFGAVAILVFLAKIGMIFALFGLLAGLVMDMLPHAGESRLKEYLAKFIGMAFLAGFAQLIFAVIITFTSIIMKIGQSLVGGNDALMMVWAGLSPLAAAYLLHWIFKRWLKKPSPMTFSGARAWTGNLSNGAGMMAGLNSLRNSRNIDDLMSSGGSRGREMRNQLGHSTAGRGQGENSGGQQMAPAGAKTGLGTAKKAPVSAEAARRDQINDAYQQMMADEKTAAKDAAISSAREQHPEMSEAALTEIGNRAGQKAAVMGAVRTAAGHNAFDAKTRGLDPVLAAGSSAKKDFGSFGERLSAVHESRGGGARGALAAGMTAAGAGARMGGKAVGRLSKAGLGVTRALGSVGAGAAKGAITGAMVGKLLAPSFGGGIGGAAVGALAGGLGRAGGQAASSLSHAIQRNNQARAQTMESYQAQKLQQAGKMPKIQPPQPPAPAGTSPQAPPPPGEQAAKPTKTPPRAPRETPPADRQRAEAPVQPGRVNVGSSAPPPQPSGPSMQAGDRGAGVSAPQPAPQAPPAIPKPDAMPPGRHRKD